MDHAKARIYGVWCQIAAFAGALLAIIYLNTPWLYIFGTASVLALLAAAVILGLYWRCPHCRRHLPADGRIFDLRDCPRCGVDLGLMPEEAAENTES